MPPSSPPFECDVRTQSTMMNLSVVCTERSPWIILYHPADGCAALDQYIIWLVTPLLLHFTQPPYSEEGRHSRDYSTMSWMFLDWFVPVYLLVSVLVLAGFGACLYFLEPGLQDAHKWSNKTVKHHPLVVILNSKDEDSNALIWYDHTHYRKDRGWPMEWDWDWRTAGW